MFFFSMRRKIRKNIPAAFFQLDLNASFEETLCNVDLISVFSSLHRMILNVVDFKSTIYFKFVLTLR